MKVKEVRIRKVIVPKKMFYKRRLYKITDIDKKYVIREYVVRLFDGKINAVFIDAPHPNSDPSTNEFCIPHKLRKLTLDTETKKFLEEMLNVFNIDFCYFAPWGEIKYEKA